MRQGTVQDERKSVPIQTWGRNRKTVVGLLPFPLLRLGACKEFPQGGCCCKTNRCFREAFSIMRGRRYGICCPLPATGRIERGNPETTLSTTASGTKARVGLCPSDIRIRRIFPIERLLRSAANDRHSSCLPVCVTREDKHACPGSGYLLKELICFRSSTILSVCLYRQRQGHRRQCHLHQCPAFLDDL